MPEIRVEPKCTNPAEVAMPRPEPCVMIIFGASGDLTRRKLIPALYQLYAEKQLPECFRIVGFARSAKSKAEFIDSLRNADSQFAGGGTAEEEVWRAFVDHIEYFQGSYDELESYKALGKLIGELNTSCSVSGNQLFYLATPPSLYKIIIGNLRDSGLIHEPCSEPWSRVIIEKPFGRDLASAKDLNLFVNSRLDESQIYRIDHYLGKETVQNILVFRFGNAIFEPLWNRNHIDHIQITAAESIGVEGRGSFYDEAGVIRDFVQNHLLEVMSLTAMEQPVSFQAGPVRDEKVKVLRSIRPLVAGMIAENVAVGQYSGYLDVDGVKENSRTPTYAAMRIMVDNWRWQGVPFYLRAGKALAHRVTEIAIHFKQVPLCLFGHDEACERLEPNTIIIRIQPNEGIKLRFACKQPGDHLSVSSVLMDFNYAEAFNRRAPDAYERLLVDAMRGDQTLFARSDAVEHAWRFVTPILEELEKDDRLLPNSYEKGSTGPKQADELINHDGRRWD